MSEFGRTVERLFGGQELFLAQYAGRTIKSAQINSEDELVLGFEDGSSIVVWDDAQHCCETRFMTCDDDPASLVGGRLLAIEVKNGPSVEEEYDDCHDQQFLEVTTSVGFITIANHNKHNGYYGGFGLAMREA